jgi:hypothetical protein
MLEEERMRELTNYRIMDTAPEDDLDEIAQIASAVCGTPMALVTFIDSHRQWYKAKKGVDMNEVRRADSFCKFTLEAPHDVLVVDNPLADDRLKDNRYVTGAPYIRFYAGAPLTSKGHVIGTVCVMDTKHHYIREDQKEALQLLAKKAMQYLNMRKKLVEQQDRIEHSAEKLKRLTDLVPGVIYQLEGRSPQHVRLNFISRGIQNIHPRLTEQSLMIRPEKFLEFVHKDDQGRIRESLTNSLLHESAWNDHFRIEGLNGNTQWYRASATIERINQKVIMYGSVQNISALRQYEEVLNQILHDVSHVMRRPVTSMLGLITLMEKDLLEPNQLREYMEHVKKVFTELDMFTRQLNKRYTEKIKTSKETSSSDGVSQSDQT